ncbi:hypothetical protein EV177_006162 [Coemansia sp. RSA 1804]|nr:hypothetical protein EV177_006162 [Coemansia sp. RSA 1804]
MISILFPHIVLLIATAFLAATAHGLGVRGTNADISSIKGGILVKNGMQTSCELGVIDSSAAFVAAPCLDFSKGVVDSGTAYEVYLDAGINNKTAKYTVNSITVHPEYNATNLINPVAILQFNRASTETWSNPIAIDRNNGWGDIALVKRELSDLNTMKWRAPSTATNPYMFPKEVNFLDIYNLNMDSLLCSNATTHTTSTYLTTCATPYGVAETYIDGKPYVAGIYSFTRLYGLSYKCTLFDGQKSYYTLLANYVAFADKVLGRKIGYYPNNNSNVVPQTDPNFSMAKPADNSMSIVYLMGDFYSAQTEALKNDNIPDTTSSTDQVTITMSNGVDNESSSIYDEVSSNSVAGAGTDSSIESASETSSDTASNESGVVVDNHDSSLKQNLIIGIGL